MINRITALALACCVLAGSARAQSGSAWAIKKSGWQLLTPDQRKQVFQYAEDYKAYMRVARSALTSSREVMRLAKAAGFAEFTDPAQVKPGTRLIVNGRDRAVILVVVGSEPIMNGSRVIGTHHDSPHIGLKARPVVGAPGGFALFKTIYYGGIKKFQWANVPLALIGRVDTSDGRTVDISIGLNPGEPVFVIPDNAPHSDRPLQNRTYNEVLAGEEMDPVAGSVPGENASVVAEVIGELTSTYKIKEEDFVSAELHLVPAVAPADVGVDRGLVGAFGQDDRLSSYCAVRALLDTKGIPRFTAVAYLSNHEEVGSVNNTGAASQLLNSTFARLVAAQRGTSYTDLDLRRALHNSQVISADTNDGVNPIFPQTSEESNAAKLGYGPAIKRYGEGFDANSEFTAHIRGILEQNGIPYQTQTPRVEVGGGGTIGEFMSAQDMEVIDMGVPLLSMHATLEMASKADLWNFYRAMKAFFGS